MADLILLINVSFEPLLSAILPITCLNSAIIRIQIAVFLKIYLFFINLFYQSFLSIFFINLFYQSFLSIIGLSITGKRNIKITKPHKMRINNPLTHHIDTAHKEIPKVTKIKAIAFGFAPLGNPR